MSGTTMNPVTGDKVSMGASPPPSLESLVAGLRDLEAKKDRAAAICFYGSARSLTSYTDAVTELALYPLFVPGLTRGLEDALYEMSGHRADRDLLAFNEG